MQCSGIRRSLGSGEGFRAVTVEEIRRCYKDFILLVDQEMRDEPRWASVVGYTI